MNFEDPENYLEWEKKMDRLFDFKNLDDKKRCKYAIRNLGKEASIWWEGVKAQRVRAGKTKISSWESLKRKLKKKYVPTHRLSIDCKMVDFEQGKSVVGEYVEKFENRFIVADSCSEIVLEEEPLYDTYPVYDDYPDLDEEIVSDEECVIGDGSSCSEIISETEQGCDEYLVCDEESLPARHVFDEMPKQDSVSRAAMINYPHGKLSNFSLHYDVIRVVMILQDTENLDDCLVHHVKLKPEEAQGSRLFGLVSISKIIGRIYYLPMLEVKLAIDSLRWDSGETRAKQSSGKPPTMNLISPHSLHCYSFPDCCFYKLQKMENVLCKTESEFNRVCDGTLFGGTYSKHMVQVNDPFSFSMIRNGKIIAWLYVSFGSRVDYGTVNRLYLGYLKRSLNVGGVDVMSRPFEGLKEEIKFYYIRTEVISFGAPFVSVRNGISSSSGVRVLGEEHEVVNGSGIGTTGYVFLRIISIRLVLYVVANHRGTTRIQVGVMIATRDCGVGNCSLTATQCHTGAAQWRPDKGEITSEVLHSYTGGFFDIGTDIRVIPGLVDFSAFLKHMFVSMSMIIIDAGCWWLFPKLGRTILTISKYLSVGTIFSSTGVVHDALSVVCNTVRQINASTLDGKAAFHIFLDFLCLYSTSTIRGVTVGFLITKNIAGLSSIITRWVVPNVFKFGVVDPIVEMIIDTERHILYARAEGMQFLVGAMSFRTRISGVHSSVMVLLIVTVMGNNVDGSRQNHLVLLARVAVLDEFKDDLNHLGWKLLSSLLDTTRVGLIVLLFNGFHTSMLARDDHPYLFIAIKVEVMPRVFNALVDYFINDEGVVGSVSANTIIAEYNVEYFQLLNETLNQVGVLSTVEGKGWRIVSNPTEEFQIRQIITTNAVVVGAYTIVGAEVMKNTRNDPCKMIPKTWKHDVMGVLAAVILFPLVNSEYFDMEYLGGIMLLYFRTWQNWLFEWLLGTNLVTYILYVTGSYMLWTFGRSYTQTDIRSLSDQFALRMLIACYARKVTCQSTTAAVVTEHGCGIDGMSELRTIPFKGGGDDTDIDHEATHYKLDTTHCSLVYLMGHICGPTATHWVIDATQCLCFGFMVRTCGLTAPQSCPSATQSVLRFTTFAVLVVLAVVNKDGARST